MRSLIRWIIIGIIVASAGFSPQATRFLHAEASVTLSWNQNREEDLAGYRLYYGIESGRYDFMEEVYLDTSLTLYDLDDMTYYFAVTAYDTAGNESVFSEEISWTPGDPVGISDSPENSPPIPRSFNLSQNYPNPFNPSTTIRYAIAGRNGREKVQTSIKIYSMRGRVVKTLVDGEQTPGDYQVHWNGKDDNGQKMASGAYLYRFQAGSFSSTRKMVLDK